MDRADQKLRELLHDKIGNATATVDPALWAGILSSIGTAASTTTAVAAAAKGTGWLGWAAAGLGGAALLTAVVIGTAEKPTRQTANTPQQLTTTATQSQTATSEETLVPSQEKATPEPTPVQKTEQSVGAQRNEAPAPEHINVWATTSDQQPLSTVVTTQGATTSGGNPGGPSIEKPTAKLPAAQFVAMPDAEDPMTFAFKPGINLPGATYLWAFGDGQSSTEAAPTHTYAEPGQYTTTLYVRHADAKADVRPMVIKAYPQGKLILPNIFTPDGDGTNDLYEPSALSKNVQILSLVITDKSGKSVFEYSDDQTVWDGNDKYGTGCPNGVYYAMATGADPAGNLLKQSGLIHLKR